MSSKAATAATADKPMLLSAPGLAARCVFRAAGGHWGAVAGEVDVDGAGTVVGGAATVVGGTTGVTFAGAGAATVWVTTLAGADATARRTGAGAACSGRRNTSV